MPHTPQAQIPQPVAATPEETKLHQKDVKLFLQMPDGGQWLVEGDISVRMPAGWNLPKLILWPVKSEGATQIAVSAHNKENNGDIKIKRVGVIQSALEIEPNPGYVQFWKTKEKEHYLLNFITPRTVDITDVSVDEKGGLRLHIPPAKAEALAMAAGIKQLYEGKEEKLYNAPPSEMPLGCFEETGKISFSQVREKSGLIAGYAADGLGRNFDAGLVENMGTVLQMFAHSSPTDTHIMTADDGRFNAARGENDGYDFTLHGKVKETPGSGKQFEVRMLQAFDGYSTNLIPAPVTLALDDKNHLTPEGRKMLQKYIQVDVASHMATKRMMASITSIESNPMMPVSAPLTPAVSNNMLGIVPGQKR